ncbi:hypothetical protein Adt_27408 [Abeliophyllum distichum]|uniref:Uncharacterized protein n=1 Tax=Abeliophyllum distichum TaxID=126358 RepID=A0ABD1RTP1_9LAMI
MYKKWCGAKSCNTSKGHEPMRSHGYTMLRSQGCYPGDQEEIKDTIPTTLWPWLNFDIEYVREGLDDGSLVLMNPIMMDWDEFGKGLEYIVAKIQNEYNALLPVTLRSVRREVVLTSEVS